MGLPAQHSGTLTTQRYFDVKWEQDANEQQLSAAVKLL